MIAKTPWLWRLGIIVGVLILAHPIGAWADFQARVIAVHEGDRLTIRHDGRNEIVYLKDIDCPSLKQPYGEQARHATAAYVGNREVMINMLQRDREGRNTANILLSDGRNIGRELVKEGLAWWQRTGSGDRRLAELEELARASGIGLWSEPHPIPPWKWKAAKKTGRYSN